MSAVSANLVVSNRTSSITTAGIHRSRVPKRRSSIGTFISKATTVRSPSRATFRRTRPRRALSSGPEGPSPGTCLSHDSAGFSIGDHRGTSSRSFSTIVNRGDSGNVILNSGGLFASGVLPRGDGIPPIHTRADPALVSRSPTTSLLIPLGSTVNQSGITSIATRSGVSATNNIIYDVARRFSIPAAETRRRLIRSTAPATLTPTAAWGPTTRTCWAARERLPISWREPRQIRAIRR